MVIMLQARLPPPLRRVIADSAASAFARRGDSALRRGLPRCLALRVYVYSIVRVTRCCRYVERPLCLYGVTLLSCAAYAERYAAIYMLPPAAAFDTRIRCCCLI